MGTLLVFLLRLLPIGLIALIKQGDVRAWLVVVAVLITGVMVLLSSAIDQLRGHFYANEYNDAVAGPLREHIGRLAPWRFGATVAYVAVLVMLVLI